MEAYMSFDFINKPVRYTKREYGLVMKTGKLKCYVIDCNLFMHYDHIQRYSCPW
jgi:hypothetical protein